MVLKAGVEPAPTEPQSAVIPLHYIGEERKLTTMWSADAEKVELEKSTTWWI